MSRWAQKNVYHRVTDLLRSPNIVKPAWYDAAVLVPPPRKTFNVPKPKRMEYKEDRLLNSFYQRVGDTAFQFLHLPGANKKGPAVAFVERQMELMKARNLTEAKAFRAVVEEANKSAALVDAAIHLASDADVLNPITEAEMKDTIDQHVKNIATHVTESWITDVMASERLSREAAEAKAVKHISYESYNVYERLRKGYSMAARPMSKSQNPSIWRDPSTIRRPPPLQKGGKKQWKGNSKTGKPMEA